MMTKSILTQLSSTLHPRIQHERQCGAIFLTTVSRYPYEILVPCDKPFERIFLICTQLLHDDYTAIEESYAEDKVFSFKIRQKGLVTRGRLCSDRWIPYENKCLKLVPLKFPSNLILADMACEKYNSSISVQANFLLHDEYSHNEPTNKLLDQFLKIYEPKKENILSNYSSPQYYIYVKHFLNLHIKYDRSLDYWETSTFYQAEEVSNVQNVLCKGAKQSAPYKM